ncbi:MAG: ABC transporter permease [bacterium]|nr:ABC transporter permease [bacterium]
MHFLLEAFRTSLRLILSFDREVYGIVLRSVDFSFWATALAVLFGVPCGFLVGSRSFKGRSLLIILLNTAMALPSVIVGLIGYAFFSRSAPLGFLDLLFSPKAVILGEFFLSLPVITNLTIAAVQSVDHRVRITARTLGAGRIRTAWAVLMEARFALMAAIVAGFGRAVSEVGAAVMLGGNIRFYTRTMTTAIALETSKGEFGLGLALGFFLLLVVFLINIFLYALQRRGLSR